MEISSYSDLLELGQRLATEDFDLDSIFFSEEFDFKIKLKGDKWDGLVDYEIANFIINIQNQINALYKEVTFDDPRYKRIPKDVAQGIKVKVKIEFGCSLFTINLGDPLKSFFKNISGKEKVMMASIVSAIICASFIGCSYIESHNELEKIKEMNKEKSELIHILDKTLDKLDSTYHPISSLVDSMDDKDHIEFVNSNRKYPADEIKIQVKPAKTKKIDSSTHYIDDEYEILRIYKDSDQASICIDGFSFLASTEPLSDNDKGKLHDIFKRAHLNKEPALLDLQIGISVDQKQLHNAYIVGIGKKRDNSISIFDAINAPTSHSGDDYPLLNFINAE